MRANETRPPAERAGPVSTTSGGRNPIIPRAEPEGLERAIESAASDWWFQGALMALKQLALSGRGFTVDNLLELVGAPTDSHYVGAVFAAAQRLKIVEPVGARVGRDGRLVRVWWGVP